MFIIIGIMISGVFIGYLLRKHKLNRVNDIITLMIWILLFLLGVEVGSDKHIINGLHTLGCESLIITAGATIGSVIAAWILWKIVIRNK